MNEPRLTPYSILHYVVFLPLSMLGLAGLRLIRRWDDWRAG